MKVTTVVTYLDPDLPLAADMGSYEASTIISDGPFSVDVVAWGTNPQEAILNSTNEALATFNLLGC